MAANRIRVKQWERTKSLPTPLPRSQSSPEFPLPEVSSPDMEYISEDEEDHPRTCPCNLVTAMTACKLGQEHVVRIERVPRDEIQTAHAAHVADGPFRGIVINKSPETGLPEVGTANILMEFTACLFGKNELHRERREKRQLKFWFRRPADRRTQAACARDYFRSLLQPEDFPKDYVNFIKKAILLSQRYPLIKRVDIVLQPAAPVPSPPDSEEEEPYPPPARSTACLPHLHPPVCTSTHRPLSRGSGTSSGDDIPSPAEDEESREPIENYITVITPAVYDYQYLPEISVSKKAFITFRVRARADAHIALSNVYGNTEERSYEVVIGGWNNTTSFIKDGAGGPILVECVTMRVLSSIEYRDFWISWKDGILQVGQGKIPGLNIFLRWDIPPKKVFSINAISVSTASSSDGSWEFVESIDEPTPAEEKAKKARRDKIRTSLLWASKKQKMLSVLEDAYPNSLDTTSLLKMSNINLRDMMPAVVFLKDMHLKGLLTEIRRGLWMRAPRNKKDKQHEVRIVLDLPRLPLKDQPTVAIVTTLFCEKQAVDAMMDSKISYVRYKMDGESTVYTIGKIGDRNVVAVKLARAAGTGRMASVAAGNQITRLIGVFSRIEHVMLVGVGGAVPNYSDHRKHIRLGDVIVSVPRRDSKESGPIYVHCDKIIHDKVKDRFKFKNRQWTMRPEHSISALVHRMRQLHESEGLSLQPWEVLVQEACDNLLDEEEVSFRRPNPKTDRLFAQIEGEMVEVEHPHPRRRNARAENRTSLRYGPVGSGKYIPTNLRLRQEFAHQTQVIAYDCGFEPVLESLRGSKCESFLVIRGMADYADGSTNKEWQPYAALSAAAYMKTLIAALPKSSITIYRTL